MKKGLLYGCVLAGWLLWQPATAQVESGSWIILTHSNADMRRVENLSTSVRDTSDAVSAAQVRSGSLVYAPGTGNDTINFSVNPVISNYERGMMVSFKAPANVKGPAYINLSSLGVKKLVKDVNIDLDSLDIRQGQLIVAVYDGINFQVINRLNNGCPQNFVRVNELYCIEVSERDSLSWWDATAACMNVQSKLCTWAEWLNACYSSGIIGTSNMGNVEEWVDSGANTGGSITSKTAGYKFTTLTFGCDQSGYSVPNNLRKFRCCYER